MATRAGGKRMKVLATVVVVLVALLCVLHAGARVLRDEREAPDSGGAPLYLCTSCIAATKSRISNLSASCPHRI